MYAPAICLDKQLHCTCSWLRMHRRSRRRFGLPLWEFTGPHAEIYASIRPERTGQMGKIVSPMCIEIVSPAYLENVSPTCIEIVSPMCIEIVSPMCIEIVSPMCIEIVNPTCIEIVCESSMYWNCDSIIPRNCESSISWNFESSMSWNSNNVGDSVLSWEVAYVRKYLSSIRYVTWYHLSLNILLGDFLFKSLSYVRLLNLFPNHLEPMNCDLNRNQF